MKQVKEVSVESKKGSVHTTRVESEKGSIHSTPTKEKVLQSEKSEHQEESAKMILEERAAIYNPNQDLWRHAPREKEIHKEDVCENSSIPSTSLSENADSKRHPVLSENSGVRTKQDRSYRGVSFDIARTHSSSLYIEQPKARDSRLISQRAATARSSVSRPSFKMTPPKARDSLLINQPAEHRCQKPPRSQVQFVPKVHFANSQKESPGKIKLSPVKESHTRKLPELPRSPRKVHSDINDEVVANLTSAWYWSGYYAGYNARLREE